tara:strand:- start:31369 stop:32241 length:873 start_codon:yes stop_codon:yes gene_type:complete
MKKLFLFLTLPLFLFYTSIAQDSITFPEDLEGWNTTWSAGISGSQASYSNWSQGGVNNIAATGRTTFTTVYTQNKFSYGFLFNSRYGKTKVQDEGVRKIDDRLFILNRFLYDLGDEESDIKLFSNIKMRTQYDDGFRYGAGVDGSDIKISGFFAPAYFNQDVGVAYIPNENFSAEAGLGLQQTYVKDRNLGPTYGLQDGEQWEFEAGFTIGSGFKTDIAANLTYSGTLNTFTAFGKSVKSTDVQVSNALTGKINDFMNASLSLDFVYDDDFSNELQIAQVLSLGVLFTIR